ncbi:MAG: hypothetical protein PUF78_03445 [Lachnospiraceae bacterium]|nr:hypothetical protein [Lachnospiraceae bacterium]
MGGEYVPPFQVTEEITSLAIEIGQYVGSIKAFEPLYPNPVLRRENRIRCIHSCEDKKEGILVRYGECKNSFWEVVEKNL